jgi:5-methylcytosine-specific restriction endonuclease McrA
MKHTDYKKRDHCKYCGSTENLTIDHKHPICLGGGDTKDNLQTLCEECNKLKSGIPDVVFRRIMYHGICCLIKNKNYLKLFK